MIRSVTLKTHTQVLKFNYNQNLGLFTGRIGSDLESSDIRSELVGLKIFGPESDPIIVGFDRVGWNIIGLWSGWIKNMNFSVIFYRIWRVGRSDWMI